MNNPTNPVTLGAGGGDSGSTSRTLTLRGGTAADVWRLSLARARDVQRRDAISTRVRRSPQAMDAWCAHFTALGVPPILQSKKVPWLGMGMEVLMNLLTEGELRWLDVRTRAAVQWGWGWGLVEALLRLVGVVVGRVRGAVVEDVLRAVFGFLD